MINECDFSNRILCGDALELINKLPDNYINLVICSPPYFQQRKYTENQKEIGNENSISEYLDKLIDVFKALLRVTTEDASLIFNLGDKYSNGNLMLIPHRFAIRVLDETEVKLINLITWVKSNPTPRQFKRRLVNSTEPFFHFVKNDKYAYYPIQNKCFQNTGMRKNVGQKYFKLIENSGLTDEQKSQAKMELSAVVEEVKRGDLYSFRMKIKDIHAMPFGGQDGGRKTQILNKGFSIIRVPGYKMQKDILECPVETIKGIKHPAIYPKEIIEKLITLTTKENDCVLDPFIGSGTTALVCKKINRRYVGFELNQDYIDDFESKL